MNKIIFIGKDDISYKEIKKIMRHEKIKKKECKLKILNEGVYILNFDFEGVDSEFYKLLNLYENRHLNIKELQQQNILPSLTNIETDKHLNLIATVNNVQYLICK